MKTLGLKWKQFLLISSNRVRVVGTIVALSATMAVFGWFFKMIERRPGVVLVDPVLAFFDPIELTWLIFLLIYFSLGAGFLLLLKNPVRWILAVQAYALMVGIRMIMMACVPLDPPPTMIPLIDPLVRYVGTGEFMTRDLFFSGHTATMTLIYLTAEGRRLRLFFGVSAIAVALSVIFQHVHYTIDVLVAPFVSYSSWRMICGAFWNRTLNSHGVGADPSRHF